MLTPSRTLQITAGLAATALLLSACGTPQNTSVASSSPAVTPTEQRQEVTSLTPRVVMTYDGGIMTLDGHTGQVIAETQAPGFLRLSRLGDGRHVAVSSGDKFTVFDTGPIAEAHGDHSHYYTTQPTLTDVELQAPEAGHVVTNGGRTALFADGTGAVSMAETNQVLADLRDGDLETTRTQDPHHGVAVPLKDNKPLITQGTSEQRTTVQVLDAHGEVMAKTHDCPGVHGEAVAEPTETDDVVTLGCENGPVIYRDGAFHKVAVAESYQRSGNQFGTTGSAVVLADYKVDPDAELERPTRIGLIKTRTDSVQTVDLGSAYWFRSMARGPRGEALVLTYNGELNILDQHSGEVLHRVAVVDPWEENDEWQQPGPAVQVSGDHAYVTDAARQKLHVVEIASGTVMDSFELPHTPNEFVVVSGRTR
ncbi:hypothetical protein [Kocuria sp. ZOR0020]|uniref:hypothetical protein n=1 Tax=Kocuria sp. ZOR0020 TaxID=1339234 RepID=UPI000A8AABB3|nr:hypothetical protein [Kocuria sp. ZOR0020]